MIRKRRNFHSEFSMAVSFYLRMDTDEDPVEKEIDVYLSKQLSESLYVLQYPLRPAHKPYQDESHLSAKIKPKQNKLEVTMGVDTRSANFDGSRGEQIVLNVDGRSDGNRTEDKYFEGNMMDKHILTGTEIGPETDKYVIGVYRNGELYLMPIKSVLQLRPGFNYVDMMDTRQKSEAKAGGDKDGESQDEDQEAKPVTMTFARHESEDAKARRMASFDYLQKQQEHEEWIQMDYFGARSHQSAILREQLIATNQSDSANFHLSSSDYLHCLMPPIEQEEGKKPDLPTNVLSISNLKLMSFSDQVKALMINAKVMRFSHLMTLMPKGSEAAQTLRVVQQVALLVQGCWVVKSEELYPADSCSAISGVPAQILSRGRDYIMWRYTQNRYLLRKDISSVIKLPAEDVKDILEQIARLKIHHGWEFMWETDVDFIHRHPEVVQRQNMLWEAKFQHLSTVLNISKADLKLAAQASANVSPKRRRTISRSRNKSGGFSDQSDTDGEGRQRHSSGGRSRRSSSGPRQRKPSTTENVTANGSLVSGDPKNTLLAAATNNVLDDGIKEKVVADPKELNDALVDFAKEKLIQRRTITVSDLRLLLSRKLAEVPPGHILGSFVSDKMLEEAVVEAGGKKLPENLFQNSTVVYATAEIGDSLDPVRKKLMEMIFNGTRIRVVTLRKSLEMLDGYDVPCEADLRKVMKEYCTTKGSSWLVKGTVDNS